MSVKPNPLAAELVDSGAWREYLLPKLQDHYLRATSGCLSGLNAETDGNRARAELIDQLIREITADGGSPAHIRQTCAVFRTQ